MAKHLLVALRHSGLLAPECRVYLPYLKQHDGVENVFEGLMADRSLDPVLVSERENPLYRATRLVLGSWFLFLRLPHTYFRLTPTQSLSLSFSLSYARTLFDEEHLHKCEGLNPGKPFLRLTL